MFEKNHYIFSKETWILHRGKDHGVSKVVREAYQNYGVMEFEFKNSKITIENKERHVKLISIARGGVIFNLFTISHIFFFALAKHYKIFIHIISSKMHKKF